jgi:hypothetical protein
MVAADLADSQRLPGNPGTVETSFLGLFELDGHDTDPAWGCGLWLFNPGC